MRFSLNLSLKLSFLKKPTFPKSCDSFNESHFQAKITTFYYWVYWFSTSLQAYCSKPLLKWSYLYLSITWLHGYDVTSTRREVATRLLFKRCTCSRHLMTVAPPKVNIWVFVKIRVLRANDVATTLGGVTPNILSKRCICCSRLVITIPLEVNYIIMVL